VYISKLRVCRQRWTIRALLWPHKSRRSNENLTHEEYHVTSVRWLKDALQLRYMSVSERLTHCETLTESSFNNLTCRKGRVFIVSLCGAHGCSWLAVGHGMPEIREMWRWNRWPGDVRDGSAAARTLGLRIRIPPRFWVSVCCVCCMLSRRRADHLSRGVLPRAVCVSVSYLETSTMRRPGRQVGLLRHRKEKRGESEGCLCFGR